MLKVHPTDSLGKYLENNNLLYIWSSNNKKSPYEYAPKSKYIVWWKCPNNKHKDFKRNILHSNNYNFRCPECNNYSKGEEKISIYLLNKNINCNLGKYFLILLHKIVSYSLLLQ